MRFFYLILLLLISTPAFARQYTQCSHDEFYSVINLPTKLDGTFFITLGAETDRHWLYDIEFSHVEGSHNVYKFINTREKGEVFVPSDIFGRSANALIIPAVINGARYQLSCFTRYYQD
jgi:hypothetical protein